MCQFSKCKDPCFIGICLFLFRLLSPDLESCQELCDRWLANLPTSNPWREKSGLAPSFFVLRQVTLGGLLAWLVIASIGSVLLDALAMVLACCFVVQAIELFVFHYSKIFLSWLYNLFVLTVIKQCR